MPLDTPARNAAERLLILTEALSEAVLNDRFEELAELIRARQVVLDQLGSMKIDATAIAVLEHVVVSERDLISLVQRSSGEAVQQMAALFAGMKQVRAYRSPTAPKGLLRTG